MLSESVACHGDAHIPAEMSANVFHCAGRHCIHTHTQPREWDNSFDYQLKRKKGYEMLKWLTQLTSTPFSSEGVC
eukprot:3360568-Amphidinium_carterae.1